MNKRLKKQLIYGGGFLLVFFIIFLIFYFLFLKSASTCFDNKQNQDETGIDCGGVCFPCEMKTLSPLENDWIKYFSVNNKAVITAKIKNSNLNYGADYFSYDVNIYDKNKNKISAIGRNSFIYVSEIKYIIEFTDINYSDIGGVDLTLGQVNWKSKEEFKKPKTAILEKTTKTGERGRGIEVSGIIINDSSFNLEKVRLIGFLNNQNGIKIGVSKTELDNLGPFSKKYFKIFFPVDIPLLSAATSTSSLFNVNLVDPNKTEIHIEAR